jgi:hypothetical protein
MAKIDKKYRKQAEGLVPWVINKESGGDPWAVSPKGALGLMQLMPATAVQPGLGVTPLQSWDPAEQIRFGTDYLGGLLQRYNGDHIKALSAFNAGLGNVDKYGGPPPFRETRAYIADAPPIDTQPAAQPTPQPQPMPASVDELDIEEPKNPANVSLADIGIDENTPPTQNNTRDINQNPVYSRLSPFGKKTVASFTRQATGLVDLLPFDSKYKDYLDTFNKQISEDVAKVKGGDLGGFLMDAAPYVATSNPFINAATAYLTTPGRQDTRAISGIAAGVSSPIANYLGGVIGSKFRGPAKEAIDYLAESKIGTTIGSHLGQMGQRLEAAASSVPIIGDIIHAGGNKGFLREFNKAAYNQVNDALGIPQNPNISAGRKGIEEVARNTSDLYNSTISNMGIKLMPSNPYDNAKNYFRDIVSSAELGKLKPDEANRVLKELNENLFDYAKGNKGYISGEALQKADSKINDLATKWRQSPQTYDMGNSMRNAMITLRDALEAENPQYAAQYVKAREGFRRLATIERASLASKGVNNTTNLLSESGIFTPNQLLGGIKFADKSNRKQAFAEGNALMQKFAESADQYFPKYPDSGTAYRVMTGGGILGALGLGLHDIHEQDPNSRYLNENNLSKAAATAAGLYGLYSPVSRSLMTKAAASKIASIPSLKAAFETLTRPAIQGYLQNYYGSLQDQLNR